MRQSEAIAIPGPAGILEAQLDQPDSAGELPAHGATALLCHPHPRFGGSMNDGVLQCLATGLGQAGYRVLRFNFRGVGASDGSYSDGVGEAQDVQAMLTWLADHDAAEPLLAGYSFGAAMAWAALGEGTLNAAATPSKLWLVAPPLAVMSLATQADKPEPSPQVIVGDRDDYCSVADARGWLAINGVATTQEPGVALTVIAGGDHFFSGKQQDLSTAVAQLISASG